jgi:hypothetical protein
MLGEKIKYSKTAANSQIGNNNPPFCFIIPEYISRQIVENRTEEQKRRAWQNLILTEQL